MALIPSYLELLFVILTVVQYVSGDVVTAFVGESVNIPLPLDCGKATLIRPQKTGEPLLVAKFINSTWFPGEDYTHPIEKSPSGIRFPNVTFNLNGMFELTCDENVSFIQLEVFPYTAISVSEGDKVKISCYSSTLEAPVKSVWWEKDGKVALKWNASNGATEFGSGFDGRAFLASDWKSTGDLSLTLEEAKLADQGNYSCFVLDHVKERRIPALIRLAVNHKPPAVGIITWPLQTPTSIIVTVSLCVLALVIGVVLDRIWIKGLPQCCRRHQQPTNNEAEEMSKIMNGGS